MKWYDPPVQTIRNPIFQTDVNEVINFITENIFQRIFSQKHLYNIKLDLDPMFTQGFCKRIYHMGDY